MTNNIESESDPNNISPHEPGAKLETWDSLKHQGSNHYKTLGGIEPIDLYRSAIPHSTYNAFDIKALTDVIKYAFRLLTKGYNSSDVGKIIHYIKLYQADCEERTNQ